MPLASPFYLVFLAAIYLAIRLLPFPRARKFLLLAASLFFYGFWDLRYLVILLVFSTFVYIFGLLIFHGWNAGRIAAIGIFLSLATLVLFKYLGPIYMGFCSAFPFLCSTQSWESANLFLPLGISFYTFQAISYLVDISKGRMEPVRDWLDFGLYMTFFPKAVAGPIVRPTDFVRQMKSELQPAANEDLAGISGLLLRGLFKKIVIADSLAGLAGVGFQASGLSLGSYFPAPIYWRSFYLYAFQIYADFSGYTDIARASGRLMGIPLPENFNYPYFSLSITDFWNRWHMSLTQWFREYVFFPLNRKILTSAKRIRESVVQASTNIATMLLIGLWHGANLTFLAWGLWHGILLSVEKRFPRKNLARWQTVLSTLLVFHLVALGWVLFRSDSILSALRFLSGMVIGGQWFLLPDSITPVVAAGLAVILVDLPGLLPSFISRYLPGTARKTLAWGAMMTVAVILIFGWVTGGSNLPFIYGGF